MPSSVPRVLAGDVDGMIQIALGCLTDGQSPGPGSDSSWDSRMAEPGSAKGAAGWNSRAVDDRALVSGADE